MATFVSHLAGRMSGVLLLSLFLSVPATVWAEVELSVGSGVMSGYTQYEIGGPVYNATGNDRQHFPISKLKFPIDAAMLQVKSSILFAGHWQIEGSVATNVTQDTGDTKDYDWGYYRYSDDPDTLDIYSESDTEMRAYLFDIRGSYRFFSDSEEERFAIHGWRLSPDIGLGYRYQYFDFTCSDTTQWDDVSDQNIKSHYSGTTLTYEAEYQIPYLSAGLKVMAPRSLTLEGRVDWAPVVNFRDWDHHKLIPKTQEADHDWSGSGYFASLAACYELSSQWFVKADLQIGHIESEDRAVQSSGKSVKQKIETSQFHTFISVGYRF